MSTKWDGDVLSVDYWNRDCDESAVAAAEAVAAMLSPYTSHFVRVDMVKCNADQKWWINELEDFGADLFFPQSTDCHETFIIFARAFRNWLISFSTKF